MNVITIYIPTWLLQITMKGTSVVLKLLYRYLKIKVIYVFIYLHKLYITSTISTDLRKQLYIIQEIRVYIRVHDLYENQKKKYIYVILLYCVTNIRTEQNTY